jgi:hypothetical protein
MRYQPPVKPTLPLANIVYKTDKIEAKAITNIDIAG